VPANNEAGARRIGCRSCPIAVTPGSVGPASVRAFIQASTASSRLMKKA
jgi:3'-phosphoadenosine 5'-phosphosulfate sulfotransferase (PAPS reductase)/FAD synthetase